MSAELVIPSPGMLLQPGFAEEARAHLAAIDDLAAVDGIRRRLAALETYVKGREQKGTAATAARWAEVRIGDLLGPAEVGANQHSEGSPAGEGSLNKDECYKFRQMAAHPDVLGECIDAGQTSRSAILDEIARRQVAAGPITVPAGTYSTLVVDPPWAYGNKATRGAAENHYRTLSMDQLVGDSELPDGTNLAKVVEGLAAPESHLYLWVTNGFLREGFDVLDAWGFTYRTCLTWVKPQMGLGNYFRSATEHVLFANRGGLRTLDRATMNWFQAGRGKHSSKPESFYGLVERSSPGPYVEMFARQRRLGWEFWGDEA